MQAASVGSVGSEKTRARELIAARRNINAILLRKLLPLCYAKGQNRAQTLTECHCHACTRMIDTMHTAPLASISRWKQLASINQLYFGVRV